MASPQDLIDLVQLSISEQLLHRNVQRFRGGLVFKAHRLCASLNSRLESNKEEEKNKGVSRWPLRKIS